MVLVQRSCRKQHSGTSCKHKHSLSVHFKRSRSKRTHFMWSENAYVVTDNLCSSLYALRNLGSIIKLLPNPNTPVVLPRSPICTCPRTNSPPFFSWLTKQMSWQEERGFATISKTWGRQNFTWSLRESNIRRYFLTWKKHRKTNHGFKVQCIHVCFVCVWRYLMEDKRLADVTPAAGGRAVV